MREEFSEILQFGEFRLDTRRKVLHHGDMTVAMPLKEIQVLSILVRQRGELVTKEELLNEVWEDSYVEESNLSRHIYLLRKTLKELGAADGLIENVPRRGYRFLGEVRGVEAGEIVLEKHTRTRTMIEFQDAAVSPSTGRSRHVAVYAVIVLLLFGSIFLGSTYLGSSAQDPGISSVAVLPFRTLGTDQNMSHTGVGLADILTTRLSTIKDLKIRPASAATAFGDQDTVEAGKLLQVDAVLEGTIVYVGERVRVTARLVRVRDATVVWSGEFDKPRRDELQLQKDLAVQIVPVLAVNLSGLEREALGRIYTQNADAYELYIRGRYEWNRRNTSGIIESQRLFRNAIAADPGFALAYVGLADSLVMSQPQVGEVPGLIAKALELDPNLAEAYATRGFYQMFYEWEWQRAEESFKRSLELNPNYVTGHHWYATLLAIKGETAAAKSEMRAALDLNPLSHNLLADFGQLHYFSGEYAEAEKFCLKALELDPDFAFAHEYLHNIYLKTGEYEKAVLEIAKADAINGAFPGDVQKLGEPMGKFGPAFRKSGINGYLETRYPGTPTSPESFYLYATKHALAGDNATALDYLEKATDARMFLSAFVKADPVFARLRGEPRYQQILRKMRLM
ncbi:MAG TPA: winged helix-turn-helix domain-containing protein [Pyrinomonadaceae bacterium]|nr:winged helix-turn-helix domain-containing protein [Pyrinomonadaceae bacterium]